MLRSNKNRRASSNSETTGETPGQQMSHASNAPDRNNFFDDFETFYYTGHFADDPSRETDTFRHDTVTDGYQVDPIPESQYQPPTDMIDEIAEEEETPVPGIRRVVIPALVQAEVPTSIESVTEESVTEEVSPVAEPEEADLVEEADPAEEADPVDEAVNVEPGDKELSEPETVPEPSVADTEDPLPERPIIRRIGPPEALPVPVQSVPITPETRTDISEPEEDDAQYTEQIHIVPALEKSAVQERDHIPKPSQVDELSDKDTTADEDSSSTEATQTTERIYFPAGFTPDKQPVAEEGVVREGTFVPKPKEEKETEEKTNLESTDAIEIRRVLSLAEAIVLEQNLRAQNPLTDLTTTEIETIMLDEMGEDVAGDKDTIDETPAPWHTRIPVTLDLQDSLNRAGEAIKPTKDSFDRWIGGPFRPSPLPTNFKTLSEPRKRSLLQEGRLEAETRGLILSSAIAYAVLWFIWLLLPANFLGIVKNQVSGQLLYQLLQAGMVLLIPLMLFAKYHPFPLGRIFGPVMPSGSQSFTSALIGIPLGVLVISLQNLSTSVIPNIYSSNLNRYMFMPQSLRPGSTVFLWVIHILLPSFLEELFFRGNLFTGLMRQGHRRAAFILPSLLYAFLFKDPLIFIPILVGVALSWVRYRSASLFGSMITHLSFAATIYFLYQNVPAFVRTMPLSSTAGQASLYASVVAAVVSAVTLVNLLAFVGTLQSPEQTNEFSQTRTTSKQLYQLREVRIGFLLFILIYVLNLGFF